MAKFTFGAIVAQARNHLAGTVFSKNAYGAYLKKKTSPGSLKTAASTQSTASFSANAKAWNSTLSQTYRDHWISLAGATIVYDVFATPQHLSGIAMFIRVNREIKVLRTLTQPAPGYTPPPLLEDAPADQTPFDIAGIVATYTAGPPYHLRITPTSNPSGSDQLVVCASTFLSVGRKLPKTNRIPAVQAFPASSSTPIDFTDMWNAKYSGALQYGAIAVAAYAIRRTNGAAGPRYAQLLLIP